MAFARVILLIGGGVALAAAASVVAGPEDNAEDKVEAVAQASPPAVVAPGTLVSGGARIVPLICRIDTLDELEYFRNGGILHYVLRQLAA